MNDRLRTAGLMLALAACALAGCSRKPSQEPKVWADRMDAEANERRLLMAQIVDDPHDLQASAALEGKAYKHLLKLCAANPDETKLDDKKNEQATFENLLKHPHLFRGELAGVKNAVVMEVEQAKLPAEYGLPGYTVLPAILAAGSPPYVQVYELRILCPPGSTLYAQLKKGIEEDKNPVMRVTGYFMKNHVKRTNRANEPPWQRPLLVCPEPTFRRVNPTYPAMSELQHSDAWDLLPSVRVDAPRSEERMVVELVGRSSGSRAQDAREFARVDGQLAALDDKAFVAQRVQAFRARLPQDHLPSAVVLRSSAAPAGSISAMVEALAAAGIKKIYVKDEAEMLAVADRDLKKR